MVGCFLKNTSGMWFFWFLLEFRFSEIFCCKIYFWDSCKNKDNIGGNILFAFVLSNRGVPDVETIYFVSIELKK